MKSCPRVLATSAALLLCISLPVKAADAAPLTALDLARCAAQVETLRTDSATLTQKNAEYDLRRATINARSAALKAERDAVKADDLEAGLAVRAKLKEHYDQTVAFNADVEKLKVDIRNLNALKKDYDDRCANRSYRRADLEAMPASAQAAMRAGLGGVQVPYLAE